MSNKKVIVQLLRVVMPLVAIVCLIVFVPWDIVTLWISPLPDTVHEQVRDAAKTSMNGIIVYVDEGDDDPDFYAAGWNDIVAKTAADPNSLFKIASISKLYIAAAAATLVADGRLSLEKTVADYLPEIADKIEHANQITLRMLLQHRSGIPNFTDQEAFDWFAPHTDINETLHLVFNLPADFEPDTHRSYSNTNYLIIGRILDKVLGFSHHQYIYDEFLNPLALTNTFPELSETSQDAVMSGYWVGYEDDLREIDYVIPGGSMIATAQEVGIFLRALNDGSLLSQEQQEIYSSIYEYGHTGWLPGYYSIARYHREIDTVVVQFVNTTGGNSITISDIIYDRIVKILNE